MVVNIIIQPDYKNTVWCKETLSGIDERICARRHEKRILQKEDLSQKTERLVIVGTSPRWVSEILDICQKLGIMGVAVSCQILEKAHGTSFVLMDHGNATRDCIGYLNSCGRSKIALFGIIENSFADKTKATFFDKDDIYPLGKDGVESCFESLYSNISKYNAVICSNYITAIYLISNLQTKNIDVPKDIYVVAYGDSEIGKMFSPSVTAITLNHALLGVQAVEVYRYLSKQEENISITASIPCRIIPAQSTECTPDNHVNTADESVIVTDPVYIKNQKLYEIQCFEKLLRECNNVDREIINKLIDVKTHSAIAEEMFISENTVKYRIRRMLKSSGISSSLQMTELYKKIILGETQDD